MRGQERQRLQRAVHGHGPALELRSWGLLCEQGGGSTVWEKVRLVSRGEGLELKVDLSQTVNTSPTETRVSLTLC